MKWAKIHDRCYKTAPIGGWRRRRPVSALPQMAQDDLHGDRNRKPVALRIAGRAA